MEPDLAIVTALWQTWVKEPTVIPPNGNRLFVRYVDIDPDDPGWNDWSLVGLVTSDLIIAWNDPDDEDSPLGQLLTSHIESGERHGRFESDLSNVEWGLFLGDGPNEDRVSDWSALTSALDSGEDSPDAT